MIVSSEYLMLEDYIKAGAVDCFPTKKLAQEYAISKGWVSYDVERIERRFERVWIVAQHRCGNKIIGTMRFDMYTVLTNKIDIRYGVEHRLTFECKKLLN